MNVANFFTRYGMYYCDKTAIVFGDKKLSFAAVVERVNRLANGLLDLGVKSGDGVALIANNCSQFLEIFFARYILGALELSVNTRLSPIEWARQINEVKAKTVFIDEQLLEPFFSICSELKGVKNCIAISGSAPNMIDYEKLISCSSSKEPCIDVEISKHKLRRIMHTGGTTGVPRGVMLSTEADMAQIRNILIDLVPDLTSEDVFLGLQPMYHAVRAFFFPCWLRGVTQVVVPNFRPEVAFDAIEREKITVIKTVPTMLIRLISSPDIGKRDLKSVRTIIYGGSPMPVEKLKDAIRIFGSVFIQNYGQSESAMTICLLRKEDHVLEGDPNKMARLASVGRPYSWVEVKIVDEDGKEVPRGKTGELIVRGDHNMTGYLGLPEETKKFLRDGWVYTRDVAKMDNEGYIFLVGRTLDMIITGGENVYPGEVEQVLYEHPAVMEACVFGIPDEQWGESVTAAVVLKVGKSATEEELIEFCKHRLARYKSPRTVTLHDSLPKSGMGKILRRELQAPYWKGREKEVH